MSNPKFYLARAVIVTVALIVLGSVTAAQAQIFVQNQRTYSRNDIERFMSEVEQSSQNFENDFGTWLNRGSINGQRREDVYNRQVRDLTDALTTLRSNFNRRNDWWLARGDMQRVLSAATSVNTFMSDRDVRGSGLNRQWRDLRTNLNTLADAFNLPQVGTAFGGIQTYPSGTNFRSCSVTGTYRGFTNTGETELTISGNGMATARSLSNGGVYNGRCANDVLYFEWGSFNVVRDGRNGIATVEIGNERNRTSYRRVGSAGYPGDVVSGIPDQYGNVPSWIVGTFRGITNDGESELTIAPNGVATARSLNTNQLYTGSYANGVLTFDWGSFRVDQQGDGIVMVDTRNRRNRTTYQRVAGYTGGVYPTYPNQNPTYPSQYGNVPGWAVGRFRGMTDTGESELTISADGTATARSLNSNQLFSGRYANGVLTFDWGSFRLIQENGGVRTEELNNPQNRASYRRVN